MSRAVHPKKDIEQVLNFVEQNGWRIEVGGSHAWGKMYCPYPNEKCRCGEFCITCIWSTPKNAMNHARQLKKVVEHCAHHEKQSI